MAERKKVKIGVTLPEEMLGWMDSAAQEAELSRSDALAECIRVLREQQKLFGKAEKRFGKRELSGGDRRKVLLSLSADNLEWLDSVAHAADVTRAEVVMECVSIVHRQTKLLNKFGLTAARRRRLQKAFGLDLEEDRQGAPEREDTDLTGKLEPLI